MADEKRIPVLALRTGEGGVDMLGDGTNTYLTAATDEQRKSAPRPSMKTTLHMEWDTALRVVILRWLSGNGTPKKKVLPLEAVRDMDVGVDGNHFAYSRAVATVAEPGPLPAAQAKAATRV